MPYINQERRTAIDFGVPPESVGELNYVFSAAVSDYVVRKGLSYQTIAEVTAALVNAKDEFYRMVAVPYENKKIIENGNVYPESICPAPLA